ncbi:MAG: hypothetical protein EBR82_53410 [Caulobacteraceae bacterium]|nr:hypothetical protein [Caulobacteraceae bacterium]
MESDWFMPIGSGGAQAVGSALSYVRRYSLMNVFGMSTSDDDDGHAATQAHLSRPTQQARQQAQNYQREAPYAATSQLPAPGYVVDANEPVTDRQTAMLNSLGYTGKQPTTKVEAGQIISRMKAQR